MREIADTLRAAGRKPYEIPVGASTPLGALGYVQAMVELLDQMPAPDVILHSTSSGGTQAGLIAACRLLALPTRVVGISADDPVVSIQAQVRTIRRRDSRESSTSTSLPDRCSRAGRPSR